MPYVKALHATPCTSQTVVALFVVNIQSGVKLPGGIGPLIPEQAQSFTPHSEDLSLTKVPHVDYAQLMDQGVDAMQPLPQSTVWSVDNPTQPLFFAFLPYIEAKAFNFSTNEVPGLYHGQSPRFLFSAALTCTCLYRLPTD